MPDTMARHLTPNWTAPRHIRLISRLLYLSTVGVFRRVGVSLPPGHAKLVEVDTPVPTPDGWTTMGAIRADDLVFDERGQPCRVVVAHPVHELEMWRVRFSDGSEILTHDEHLWVTSTNREGRRLSDRRRKTTHEPNHDWPEDWAVDGRYSQVRTTAQIAATLDERHSVPTTRPLDLPEADLPLDPWVLGYWLGNGSTDAGVLCAGSRDGEMDHPHVTARLEAAGYSVACREIPDRGQATFGVRGLSTHLRALGVLGNKHVPSGYLRASAAQRLNLLRGLMDSDGTFSKSHRNLGRVSFSSTLPALRDAVFELFAGLGAKPTVIEGRARLNGKDHGPYWRVEASPPFQVFSLPRKARQMSVAHRQARKNVTRYVESVEPTGVIGRMRCLTVDSKSGCFLVGRAMIPTHNSTTCSHWFPLWQLEHWPDRRLILAQYEATLAEEWGKAVRATINDHPDELRVRLRQDSQAANRWRTEEGGGMWTAGTNGAITGRRASTLLIDDPLKNFQEAHSPTIREAVWRFYTSTGRTRLLPGGSVVVVMTRWHEDDLIGRIAATDEDRDQWVFVRLPAIAECDETIVDVIGARAVRRLTDLGLPVPSWHRAEGEPLWPELTPGVPWYDLDELNDVRAEVGEYVWTGLYQQRPSALEGELFRRDAWAKVPAAPANLDVVRRWDFAATEKKQSDYTVGVLMGRSKVKGDRRVYVLDVRRDRIGPAGVERLVRATAEDDREAHGSVPIRIEREPGSSGVHVENHYVTDVLAGFDVAFVPASGDKVVRAMPLSAQQTVGNVALVSNADGSAPGWWQPYIDELAAFPNGNHDDQVDASSGAYADLLARRKIQRRARVSSVAGRSMPG